MDKQTAVDAFNLLAGEKLGSGTTRDVFACKLRPELVVKVEIVPGSSYRRFANVLEMMFWNDNSCVESVRKWLAKCEYLSPDGLILLQERVQPATQRDMKRLPEKLPAFLTDRKVGNFGWTEDGRLVCCDYALTNNSPSLRKTKADWWW